MPHRPRSAGFLAWAASLLVLTALVLLCVCYVDVPLANYVKTHFYVGKHWSRLTSNLPDLLLQTVLLVTLLSFLLYRVRVARGIHDSLTRLARLVTWAAPAAYLAKILFKFVFGRVNTRVWLEHPDLYQGFRWFQGQDGFEGFPSGHMVVIVALIAALWRFYPRWRLPGAGVGVGLGAVLVATDYHFLSDVLAGAWLGVLVETAVSAFLSCRPLPPDHAAR